MASAAPATGNWAWLYGMEIRRRLSRHEARPRSCRWRRRCCGPDHRRRRRRRRSDDLAVGNDVARYPHRARRIRRRQREAPPIGRPLSAGSRTVASDVVDDLDRSRPCSGPRAPRRHREVREVHAVLGIVLPAGRRSARPRLRRRRRPAAPPRDRQWQRWHPRRLATRVPLDPSLVGLGAPAAAGARRSPAPRTNGARRRKRSAHRRRHRPS